MDRRILLAIIDKYNGGPVGLNTIAASVSEEADTIMDVVEPYLLQLGYLDRTAQVGLPHNWHTSTSNGTIAWQRYRPGYLMILLLTARTIED